MRLPEDIAARANWLRSHDFEDRVKTQECLALTEAAKQIIESDEFRAQPLDFRMEVARALKGHYDATFNRMAIHLIPGLEMILDTAISDGASSTNVVCELYEILYAIYWYTDDTLDGQRPFLDRVARPVGEFLYRNRRVGRFVSRGNNITRWLQRWIYRSKPIRVGYIMYWASRDDGNGLGPAALIIIRALKAAKLDVYVYVCRASQASYVATLTEDGAHVRDFRSATASVEIAYKIADQIREDQVDALISDINLAIPAVIFSERAAPLQIFHQFGMPFWAVRNTDMIFTAWNTEPERLGFEPARCHQIDFPWDSETLKRPRSKQAIAAERAQFPESLRCIGVYGRLLKVTDTYLNLSLRVIHENPNCVFLIGGTGDPMPIRNFIEQHGVAERLILVPRFVDGHIWSEFLDIFVNTFPLAGGYSTREMAIRGKPVVSMPSKDMPNLVDELDPALIARSESEYVEIIGRLLNDEAFYSQRSAEARRIAAANADIAPLARQLSTHIAEGLYRTR